MKCKIIIDKEHLEEVVIYAHEKSKLTNAIEQLISEDTLEIIGYNDKQTVLLSLNDIYCFVCEDNKIYAVTKEEKLQIKFRLYTLEEKLSDNFIKINQSCIANIKKIERFDATFRGTLRVIFKNGHQDFVSRRQLKNVKKRLGI